MIFIIIIAFISIFIFAILIVHAIYQEEQKLESYTKVYSNRRSDTSNLKVQISKFEFEKTKSIAKQCGLYLIAFLLTWIPTIIANNVTPGYRIDRGWILAQQQVLSPLQGFWSFIIFTYHKVDTICRADKECSRWKAFGMLFTSSTYPTVFVSNLNEVSINARGGNEEEILEEIHDNAQLDNEKSLGEGNAKREIPDAGSPHVNNTIASDDVSDVALSFINDNSHLSSEWNGSQALSDYYH